jgi:serine phosphatase RsbU (regulator of sigma subunit)
MRQFFADYFTIYQPKDIVSGDFYWFHQINENKAIFILADCTGHGVAGAFMSMIGNSLLYKLIKIRGLQNPTEILQSIHKDIFTLLKQAEGKNKDGMDIAICYFEKQAHHTKVTFAGAKSMVIYTHQGDSILLQGDRISIGGTTNKVHSFNNQEFTLIKGDKIYFFSDGYIDQNDSQRQRFGSKRFFELITKINPLEIEEQKNQLLLHLQQHQQNEEQRDDISIVGIKL